MNNKLTILLTILSSTLCNTIVAQTEENILLEQHKNIQRLNSIELKSTKSKTFYPPPNITEKEIAKIPIESIRNRYRAEKSTINYQTHFIAEGNKYYIQAFKDDSLADGSPEERTSTYNDKGYSDLSGTSGRLDTSQKPIIGEYYPSPSGFLDAYGYIASQKPKRGPTLTLLYDEATWREIASSTILVGETNVDGYEVVILDIMSLEPNDASKTKVYCAKEYGYYPIQYERIDNDGSIMSRFKASGLKRHTGADGIEILLHASSVRKLWYNKEEGSPLKATYTVEIDQDSLRINEPIDDSVFESPTAHANIVVNNDTGAAFRVKDENIIIPPPDVSDISLAQEDTNDNEPDDKQPVPQAKETTTIEEPQQKRNPIYLGIGIMVFIALSIIILNKRKQKNT